MILIEVDDLFRTSHYPWLPSHSVLIFPLYVTWLQDTSILKHGSVIPSAWSSVRDAATGDIALLDYGSQTPALYRL